MEANSTQHFLVKRVKYLDILNDPRSPELLAEYSAECSISQIGEPEPQREIYAAMESSGLMHSFGFYEGEIMIGFATLLIHILPHYGKLIANVESIVVQKAHRVRGAGEILKISLEEYAKDRGCVGILYNARAGSRLEKLLTLQPEYERTNSVFLRSFA
jgi:GNAT superfamily N-acetyltransferase